MNHSNHLRPSEVAKRLRVGRARVYAWLDSGELRGYKIGKHWRVEPADLDAFVRKLEGEDKYVPRYV